MSHRWSEPTAATSLLNAVAAGVCGPPFLSNERAGDEGRRGAGYGQAATRRLLWAVSRTGAQGLSALGERIQDVSNRLSHNSSTDASKIQISVQRAESF